MSVFPRIRLCFLCSVTVRECSSTELENALRRRVLFGGGERSAELAFCISIGYIRVFTLQGLCVPEHFSSSLFSPLSLPRAGSLTHLVQLLLVQFSTIVQFCSTYHVSGHRLACMAPYLRDALIYLVTVFCCGVFSRWRVFISYLVDSSD